MKMGMRKPSVKRSIKARTTGSMKRSIKKAVIPAYSKRGTGLFKSPRKALYNKVYKRVTFDLLKLLGLRK